jgi:hypothetical protein
VNTQEYREKFAKENRDNHRLASVIRGLAGTDWMSHERKVAILRDFLGDTRVCVSEVWIAAKAPWATGP